MSSSRAFLIAGVAAAATSILLYRRLVRLRNKVTVQKGQELIISCWKIWNEIASEFEHDKKIYRRCKKVIKTLQNAKEHADVQNESSFVEELGGYGDEYLDEEDSFMSANEEMDSNYSQAPVDEALTRDDINGWLHPISSLTSENLAKFDVEQYDDILALGLEAAENDEINVRKLRHEILQCIDEIDFLGKLYCIRLAFDRLFDLPQAVEVFKKFGCEFGCLILEKANAETKDYTAAYYKMIQYMELKPDIMEDLERRGVKCANFYDVVIDYLILDAFDDLANPDPKVSAIINNRWIPRSTMVAYIPPLVGSLLSAKISMSSGTGFMGHAYPIAQTLVPSICGFLGIDDDLKEFCSFATQELKQFCIDIFSNDDNKYDTIQKLQVEIILIAQEHLQNVRDY